jgi:hypothetical protein
MSAVRSLSGVNRTRHGRPSLVANDPEATLALFFNCDAAHGSLSKTVLDLRWISAGEINPNRRRDFIRPLAIRQ